MPIKSVLVTGGAGYVGAILVPKLLKRNFSVKVIDKYIYGDMFSFEKNPNLREIKGDIRDEKLLRQELSGSDAVIHLACISNDPSFELNPTLGKAINYDATIKLVDVACALGVKRFIYASSSSVYGVKEEDEVTEDLPLNPLTDYSKYKMLSEKYILQKNSAAFTVLVLRPATVCGYSPRLRLDLTVNILTIQALVRGEITVFGGSQLRPNIHIEDMTDLYVKSLEYSDEKISGKIFNAGYENYSLMTIAKMVKQTLNKPNLPIKVLPTEDLRSYRISSRNIRDELGFVPTRSIESAIRNLAQAYSSGKIPNALTQDRYYNIRTMKRLAI